MAFNPKARMIFFDICPLTLKFLLANKNQYQGNDENLCNY